jgi:hypothetical protein
MTRDNSTNFFSLPSELRNKIYELVLVHDEPIDPCGVYWPSESPNGLFRVSKTIHREATSFFYAQNCFDLSWSSVERINAFFKQIGRTNASYIRHIRIEFPSFPNLDTHHIVLDSNSVRILQKLQTDCVKLRTLTTSPDSTNDMEVRLEALNNPKIVREVLKLVNARFKSFSSLEEVIVEVYEGGLSEDIRQEMKALGWTISATECVDDYDDYRYSAADCVGDDGYDNEYDSYLW